ncbi:hypothetical protein ACFOG5_24410 [Pedobacter fastidiosus]|uniref:hypothetical protein n=1 Tax=Pedobacter fastidiosus TaxID=2765361 RepID=UPI003613D708
MDGKRKYLRYFTAPTLSQIRRLVASLYATAVYFFLLMLSLNVTGKLNSYMKIDLQAIPLAYSIARCQDA